MYHAVSDCITRIVSQGCSTHPSARLTTYLTYHSVSQRIIVYHSVSIMLYHSDCIITYQRYHSFWYQECLFLIPEHRPDTQCPSDDPVSRNITFLVSRVFASAVSRSITAHRIISRYRCVILRDTASYEYRKGRRYVQERKLTPCSIRPGCALQCARAKMYR